MPSRYYFYPPQAFGGRPTAASQQPDGEDSPSPSTPISAMASSSKRFRSGASSTVASAHPVSLDDLPFDILHRVAELLEPPLTAEFFCDPGYEVIKFCSLSRKCYKGASRLLGRHWGVTIASNCLTSPENVDGGEDNADWEEEEEEKEEEEEVDDDDMDVEDDDEEEEDEDEDEDEEDDEEDEKEACPNCAAGPSRPVVPAVEDDEEQAIGSRQLAKQPHGNKDASKSCPSCSTQSVDSYDRAHKRIRRLLDSSATDALKIRKLYVRFLPCESKNRYFSASILKQLELEEDIRDLISRCPNLQYFAYHYDPNVITQTSPYAFAMILASRSLNRALASRKHLTGIFFSGLNHGINPENGGSSPSFESCSHPTNLKDITILACSDGMLELLKLQGTAACTSSGSTLPSASATISSFNQSRDTVQISKSNLKSVRIWRNFLVSAGPWSTYWRPEQWYGLEELSLMGFSGAAVDRLFDSLIASHEGFRQLSLPYTLTSLHLDEPHSVRNLRRIFAELASPTLIELRFNVWKTRSFEPDFIREIAGYFEGLESLEIGVEHGVRLERWQGKDLNGTEWAEPLGAFPRLRTFTHNRSPNPAYTIEMSYQWIHAFAQTCAQQCTTLRKVGLIGRKEHFLVHHTSTGLELSQEDWAPTEAEEPMVWDDGESRMIKVSELEKLKTAKEGKGKGKGKAMLDKLAGAGPSRPMIPAIGSRRQVKGKGKQVENRDTSTNDHDDEGLYLDEASGDGSMILTSIATNAARPKPKEAPTYTCLTNWLHLLRRRMHTRASRSLKEGRAFRVARKRTPDHDDLSGSNDAHAIAGSQNKSTNDR